MVDCPTDTRPDRERPALQFNLVHVAAWQSTAALVVFCLARGDEVAAVLVMTVGAAIGGVFLQTLQWRQIMRASSAILASILVVLLLLASGFSGTLPLLGKIPGPPTNPMQVLAASGCCGLALFAIWQTMLVLRYGTASQFVAGSFVLFLAWVQLVLFGYYAVSRLAQL